MSEFKYKEQYGVIVICKSEEEQKHIYEALLAQGLTLKIVTV
jgi:predicted 3-demethylubiquinone-9 3-methyltransferase (glyoxalase superfamily)